MINRLQLRLLLLSAVRVCPTRCVTRGLGSGLLLRHRQGSCWLPVVCFARPVERQGEGKAGADAPVLVRLGVDQVDLAAVLFNDFCDNR